MEILWDYDSKRTNKHGFKKALFMNFRNFTNQYTPMKRQESKPNCSNVGGGNELYADLNWDFMSYD